MILVSFSHFFFVKCLCVCVVYFSRYNGNLWIGFISNGVCGQTLNIIAKLAGVRFMFGGGGRLVDWQIFVPCWWSMGNPYKESSWSRSVIQCKKRLDNFLLLSFKTNFRPLQILWCFLVFSFVLGDWDGQCGLWGVAIDTNVHNEMLKVFVFLILFDDHQITRFSESPVAQGLPWIATKMYAWSPLLEKRHWRKSTLCFDLFDNFDLPQYGWSA